MEKVDKVYPLQRNFLELHAFLKMSTDMVVL